MWHKTSGSISNPGLGKFLKPEAQAFAKINDRNILFYWLKLKIYLFEPKSLLLQIKCKVRARLPLRDAIISRDGIARDFQMIEVGGNEKHQL